MASSARPAVVPSVALRTRICVCRRPHPRHEPLRSLKKRERGASVPYAGNELGRRRLPADGQDDRVLHLVGEGAHERRALHERAVDHLGGQRAVPPLARRVAVHAHDGRAPRGVHHAGRRHGREQPCQHARRPERDGRSDLGLAGRVHLPGQLQALRGRPERSHARRRLHRPASAGAAARQNTPAPRCVC